MNSVLSPAKKELSARNSIEAEGISKVYWDGDRRLDILKGVTFSVAEGEGVAILGPSGSGKTTLLNLLSGLDRPTEGTVKLDGVDLGKLGEKEKALFRNERIGFVFQFYHLLSEFSALENVMLPALIGPREVSRRKASEKAAALLDRVGLQNRSRHFPSELSGGEQQRVAIARALMNDPKILFCDEPTGNLDPKMSEDIAALIRDFFDKEKRTVLVVTHDQKVAKITNRIWNVVTQEWTLNREKMPAEEN